MRLPAQLLKRRPNSHKGNFGHIFILAGSSGLSGAGVLCSYAALRSGAGLVTLGIPKGINNAIIKIKPPEVMTKPLAQISDGAISIKAFPIIKSFLKKIDILVIGPGLSQNSSTQSLIRRVIKTSCSPMVIDADGLNALVGDLDILRKMKDALPAGRQERREPILTPHPGEMARLLGISAKEVQANREKIAKRFASDYSCVVVLKGYKTIVSSPEGKIYINSTGNPGMATAGVGDVLTGIIASFLAQGLSGFEAAKYAVYLHGLAGDLAAKEKTQIGMIASDIIEKIPEAIKYSS